MLNLIPLSRSTAMVIAWFALFFPMGNFRAASQTPLSGEQAEANELTDADRSGRVDPWPRFLGNNFDGVAPAVNARLDASSQPSLRWSIEVGDGYGIGTVADGRYLHFDAAPSEDRFTLPERLRSFDLQTGKLQWSQSQPIVYRDRFGYEAGPRSSPTIAGDQVFTFGVTGRLSCRNLADGQLAWSVDTSEKYGVVQNFFGVGSSPLVAGDQVIVMVGGSPPEDQNVAPLQLDRVSPNGTALVAFDRKTGTQRWATGDDLASYSCPRTVTLDGETLVLIFARGGLLAVDPQTGKQRWHYPHRAGLLESVNAMMPVVHENEIFISECYEVGSALLKASGQAVQEVWKDPPRDRRMQSMRSHWATPILIDGYLYGCSGRNSPDSDFRCIRWRDGEVQWSDGRRTRSSVTQVGSTLVLIEERGLMQFIEPTPEALKVIGEWDLADLEVLKPALRYPCWAAPIFTDGKLLLRGTDHVVCLDVATH